MADTDPTLAATRDGAVLRIAAAGTWTVLTADQVDRVLAGTEPPDGVRSAQISLSDISRLDTAGAWLIVRFIERWRGHGLNVELSGLDEHERTLIDAVSSTARDPVVAPPERPVLIRAVEGIGQGVIESASDLTTVIDLLGEVVIGIGRWIANPSRARMTSVIYQLEFICIRAVPIVVLISLAIGAVIAQQAIFQLGALGAEQLAVVFIGIVVLRELGVLLTAIMIAGRSGSSITAEIGAMRMREEVDAMRTLAINPIEVLVIPRVIALLIALPALTVISNLAALFASALIAWSYMDMPPSIFFDNLRERVDIINFWRGIVKAPFMALFIGLIACIEGFRVRESTESLGRHTTAAVVKSIFTVIAMAALFAILYYFLDS
ncbi:MAG: ABC transporter permease [Pseudomonadota bacterium]